MNSFFYPQKPCGLPFKEAIQRCPTLGKYATKGKIDLGNSEALLLYNQLVLNDFMSLDFNVPPGYLIPTVCSRWQFVSWIIREKIPLKVLEIGTGASAILAMMFAKIGCHVEVTEIDEMACQSAQHNINLNGLDSRITLKKIEDEEHILINCYESLRNFDLVVCNPPQYDQNYFKKRSLKKGFVGQELELVGGKEGHEFILKLIEEINYFSKSPSFYFQLTFPKLYDLICINLQKKGYTFLKECRNIGTRKRYYFRVDF